jgi:hypothetical protein
MLLLAGVVLAGFLYVGAVFLQGYFYTGPSEQLIWGAPAAAAVLTLFLGLWCLLDANNPGSTPQDIPYDSFFRFSPRVDMMPTPAKEIWAVRQGSKEPIAYKLVKVPRAGFAQYEYREAKRPEHTWSTGGVQAILLKRDGEMDRFLPRKGAEGGYREFVDEDGWTMKEYDTGPTGQPTKFRFGRFLANLLLNLLHLGLWFGCLWVLLRFQWSHALGLGFVLWLVMTLSFLPALLDQAARLAWPAGVPPAGTAALDFYPPCT